MGTSSSIGQFTGKLEKLAKEMGDTKRPLNVVALEAKRTMMATAPGAVGRRVTGKRKIIGVRYNIRGEGSHAVATVGYTGPAHLLNNATSAHEIRPKRAGGRRSRRGAAVLRFNAGDGGFAPSAHHPGTRGMHFFEKARTIVAQQAPRTYSRVGLTEPLRRTFH